MVPSPIACEAVYLPPPPHPSWALLIFFFHFTQIQSARGGISLYCICYCPDGYSGRAPSRTAPGAASFSFGPSEGEGWGDPLARAHPGAVSPWSQAVPPTTARRFLPPRSLETRTSLSHPRSPPCARAQQMGGRAGAFRAERGSNELSRSVRGPQLRPGCRKRPRGHQRHSFLACPQTCSSRASLLGQVASDLRLFAPRQRRSLGNTEWGGSRAARHRTPRPQVPAARPRPLPTSQIIQSQQMSPRLPAGRTLRSLAGQGPRTVDG